MNSDAARLHAVVQGRVQGVGFRDFVLNHARQLGVTGVVRNLPDRSVEVVAEGWREDLNKLLAYLRVGPASSGVANVDVSWTEAAGNYLDFRITG